MNTQSLRLKCLELALTGPRADDAVNEAQRFYNYLINKPEAAARTKSAAARPRKR